MQIGQNKPLLLFKGGIFCLHFILVARPRLFPSLGDNAYSSRIPRASIRAAVTSSAVCSECLSPCLTGFASASLRAVLERPAHGRCQGKRRLSPAVHSLSAQERKLVEPPAA